MEKKYAEEILSRFENGTASDEEKVLVSQWTLFGEFPEVGISEAEIAVDLLQIDSRLPIFKSDLIETRPGAVALWKKISVAASIVLVASVGLYIYRSSLVAQDYNEVAVENKILPGENRAILTLSDGKKIDLSGARSGDLVSQGRVKVSKTADGQLVYSFAEAATQAVGFNSVATPNGGQYQISLPDGSKVWLNAASSLKFPVSFAGLVQRKVELTGEAYFEVAKDKKHPFMVSSIGQTVEVLGTHFDVNSYGDGGKLKTTLLEGSVMLSVADNISRVLVPGEQASFGKGSDIKVVSVDTEESVAWKNGYFMFNGGLEEIMSSISRWYDVEIEFKDKDIKDDPFWGTVSRFAKVGDVLKVLERTGEVHFEIKGRKIIVSR